MISTRNARPFFIIDETMGGMRAPTWRAKYEDKLRSCRDDAHIGHALLSVERDYHSHLSPPQSVHATLLDCVRHIHGEPRTQCVEGRFCQSIRWRFASETA